MNRQHQPSSEQGSLPMVLLAAIILAGVVVALFTTVSTGVDTAQRDRDWHAAVQVADAGIQQAIPLIREDAVAATCDENLVCEGEVPGRGAFTVTYEQDGDDWLVCSRGEVGEEARTLCAELGAPSLFGGAGVIGIDKLMVSGNLNKMPPGVILGTAGEFDMNDNVCSNIDGTEVYTSEDEGDPDIDPVCPTYSVIVRDFPNLAQDAFEADDGVCNGAEIWDSYPDSPPSASVPEPWKYGEIYCTRYVNLNRQGDISLTGNPSDGPVEVYVYPSPEDTGSTSVYYRGNDDLNAAGDALDLLFFVGGGTVELDLAGTPVMKALWYAPTSTCSLKGTPDFYGAILCQTTDLRGAVEVHVPDGLRDLKMGPTKLTRVYE